MSNGVAIAYSTWHEGWIGTEGIRSRTAGRIPDGPGTATTVVVEVGTILSMLVQKTLLVHGAL